MGYWVFVGVLLFFVLVYIVVTRVLAFFFKYPTRIPTIVNVILCIATLVIPYLIIMTIWTGRSYTKVTNAVIANPNDSTVGEFLLFMGKFTVTNEPNVWNGLREIWDIINHSPNVSTELKHKTLATLRTKGMYIGSSKVIDNYGK